MGTRLHTLKTLRAIALNHGVDGQPDLALMAREMGRVVHENASSISQELASLQARGPRFERWLLAERRSPALSALVTAWPPGHVTPVHDHGGLWGLEVVLVGALEVQSYVRDPSDGNLLAQGRNWLGPGDATWFEGDPQHAHRCRNLSRHDTALTLHVYGGDLAQYFAYERAEPAGRWTAHPERAAIAGRLFG